MKMSVLVPLKIMARIDAKSSKIPKTHQNTEQKISLLLFLAIDSTSYLVFILFSQVYDLKSAARTGITFASVHFSAKGARLTFNIAICHDRKLAAPGLEKDISFFVNFKVR